MHAHLSSGVDGIEHVEIYVDDCEQAAHGYQTALGFSALGEVRDRDSLRDRRTIALRQGDIRLLLTAPLTADSDVAQHIHEHGEGIKDVALSVTNVDAVFERAIGAGARSLRAPSRRQRRGTSIGLAQIEGCRGALVHTLVERSPEISWMAGQLHAFDGSTPTAGAGLVAIDHLAMAVPEGTLDTAVAFYVEALGFRATHQENVTTEYSAMRSKVVQTPNAAVRFPIMEPAPGRRRSQIETYLNAHGGAGVQHLALRCENIVSSVSRLGRTIEFLPTPNPYYESLEARVGALAGELQALRRHGILVDRDETGLLLQVFTKPIGARPTLFLELIERRGAQGFGGGNIKALFEAVERAEAASATAS